ncbi:VanZ family protein [Catalinimonas sp. 4WD22]|uniref:VanZ family protein n=1 Tax=Catalinimonas locisalis TaxID=3133978 RepID=UPI0031014C42
MKYHNKRKIFYISSLLYLSGAIWLLFFFPYLPASRANPDMQRFINPIPFETTFNYFYNALKFRDQGHLRELLFNVGGNILLFVPMGVIIYQLNALPQRYWLALLLGFLISSSVETLQIISNTGHFDIDDILLNSLGTLLGYHLACKLPLLMNATQ